MSDPEQPLDERATGGAHPYGSRPSDGSQGDRNDQGGPANRDAAWQRGEGERWPDQDEPDDGRAGRQADPRSGYRPPPPSGYTPPGYAPSGPGYDQSYGADPQQGYGTPPTPPPGRQQQSGPQPRYDASSYPDQGRFGPPSSSGYARSEPPGYGAAPGYGPPPGYDSGGAPRYDRPEADYGSRGPGYDQRGYRDEGTYGRPGADSYPSQGTGRTDWPPRPGTSAPAWGAVPTGSDFGQAGSYGQPSTGAGAYGGQPDYGRPDPFAPSQQPFGAGPARSNRTALVAGIAGLAVVLLVLVILAFVAPGFLRTEVFDQSALQDGVRTVLQDNYGETVSSVTCPADQPVEVGASFTCRASIDGNDTPVTVSVTDDQGTYEVARP